MPSSSLTPQALVEKSEIIDVLYRYAKGIDDQNTIQVLSCFADDVQMNMLGQKIEGIEMLGKLFRGELAGPKAIGIDRINASTHVLANILIEINGNTATSDTQGIAHLYCTRGSSEAFLVRGIRYLDKFEKIDRGWVIKSRTHTATWQFETAPSRLS